MEKQFKCFLLLSLKEISLRRVAALLWNSPDILDSISKFPRYRRPTEERQLVHKIKNKMLELELPESQKNQMIELVEPMSLEVREWKDGQQGLIESSTNAVSLPDSAKLCWTTAGTIDYRKTAEELFRCDKLDVVQRYRIACYYCLEDRISLYWEDLPEFHKVNYGTYKDPLTHMTHYWSYILKGKHFEFDNLAYSRNRTSFNQLAFEDSAKRGNKTAAEYFFQKLTHEEREASLMRTARAVMAYCNTYVNIVVSNILFYFLSLMTPEQQMEIIKAYPIDVFSCFLRSQLQGLFREYAGLLWALFPPSSYITLLKKILDGYPLIYFPRMIEDFFMESPQDFKTCFVDETSLSFPKSPAYQFLDAFFRWKDPESMKAVFRNVDTAIRVKLVRRNICLFCDYMSRDEWQLVELCLREATLSKEEKGRLKDDFAKFLERKGGLENPVFKGFFEFLDETDASSDQRKKGQKRKLENCSPE